MSMTNAGFSVKTNDYGTPEYVIRCVRNAMGGRIDLDPASNFEHNKRVGALKYYAPPCDDGLVEDWYGNVFCNPPYGKKQKVWVVKAEEEFLSGRAEQIVMLIGSSLHAKWFQPYWNYHICICSPRINFVNGTSSNSHDNVIVGFGFSGEDFAEAFGVLGKVLMT